MWEIRAEAVSKASAKKIWDIWTDVSAWPVWDHELQWAKLNGPFAVGTRATLKPKGFFASGFEITSAEVERRMSDETKMPFTKVVFDHFLIPEEGKVRIVHHVRVSGLLAPLLYCTMRLKLAKGLPIAIKALANLAESK